MAADTERSPADEQFWNPRYASQMTGIAIGLAASLGLMGLASVTARVGHPALPITVLLLVVLVLRLGRPGLQRSLQGRQ